MDTASSKPTRIGPWTAIGILIVVFAVLEFVLPQLRALITPHLTINGPRNRVAVLATSSIVLDWALFATAWIVLRQRGQTLSSIGWRMRAKIWGWLLALFFAVLYGGFTMMGMAHAGAPVFTDWSFFRVAIALGVGITAGICEETVLRGFVMTQARDGGAHWIVQIVISALLFGLAHMGWGAMTGHVQMAQALGAVAATTVLGLMMAIAYLAGGRSLTPVIVAHGIIDIVVEPWLLLFAVTGGHF